MLESDLPGVKLNDSNLSYTCLCPSCGGSFSIPLEQIPPVRARFRCLHCEQPMDFPSRDEARARAVPRAQAGAPAGANAGGGAERGRATPAPRDNAPDGSAVGPATRFRVEKPGFETDVYDRRAVRNLIRTGQILEDDRICVDDGDSVPAGKLPYLQSLFNLRKQARGQPPVCCRTHTDQVAFFKCHETGRPLCDECAAERKFGGATIRVCLHCGGTTTDLEQA